jgi:hypothetical protein
MCECWISTRLPRARLRFANKRSSSAHLASVSSHIKKRAGRLPPGNPMFPRKFGSVQQTPASMIVRRVANGSLVPPFEGPPARSRGMDFLRAWGIRGKVNALSQMAAIDPDESTDDAIGDWHY